MIDRPSKPATAVVPTLAAYREITFAHGEHVDRAVVSIATSAITPTLEATAAAWLSERELARVSRAVAKRRHEFMLGRYVAKTALAAWNRSRALDAFTILPGAFEQPVVQEASRAEVTLAHTANVAIAIAHDRGHPMGVDIEWVDAERIEVLRTQVGREEMPAGIPYREHEALFLLWSAKEALSKALRCGLTCPFEVLAVSEVQVDANRVCTGSFRNFSQYRFASWLAEGFAFAFVGSRNAKLEPVLPEFVRFSHESVSGKR